MAEEQKNIVIESTEISSEMKRAYLNYAMSVIVSRALPDVRDGLKPVHRRILYAMYRLGLTAGARFSKSAKVVGEVLGKYHPHGDAPVYEALVRMAQDFSMRYPLIKGQGNFGSVDGDPPAAMRYTEVKLTKIAEEMLFDIDKETVPVSDNFDGSLTEPQYLPGKLPNLLLMGAEGIAVGMATKIPPHNITEIIDGLTLMIDAAKIEKGVKKSSGANYTAISAEKLTFATTLDELLVHIKGPDFPTAGIIYGASDIKQAYATGKGKILIRAKIESETVGKGKEAIIVTELPYQVNKAHLVEKIATLVRDKKIVGISDIRDESDREGIRVVIELKRDAAYKKVVNNLFKYTELQTSFPINMVALVDGTPHTLSLPTILGEYVKHRVETVTKRSEFELKEAKARAHILEGLLIALSHIDAIIDLIKKSKNEPEAKIQLVKKFKLSEIQAQAILDMQLKRLTGLERNKIEDELKSLREKIAYLEGLLADVLKILKVIKKELLELKEKYGDERKTKIVKYRPGEFSDEELIENKEVIVILTKEGYVKQIPKETFKVQQRGGKGVSGFETKEEDNVYYITSAMTHDSILFFSNKGKVYQTRVWEIPTGTRTSKGKALVNVITISGDEKVTSILTYNSKEFQTADRNALFTLMCTKFGTVKKTPLSEFFTIRSSGIIAIKLETHKTNGTVENDELLWAHITNRKKMVVIATRRGKSIVFPEGNVNPTGRNSIGVRGIELEGGDFVTSVDIFNKEEADKKLIVISEKGIGKKTFIKYFRQQKRGGKGVKIANIDERTGQIIFSQIIDDEEKTIIITSRKGQVVKTPVKTIPTLSRTAKGVILMRFSNKSDRVSSATFM
ncbi:MAG TPA: DNA gyrase subunit A [Patescibacteria group bacterium]|nr:DNA gyrase subunit A [Patescibacteria group bacterium]